MKQFKVVAITANANSFGVFGHVLVARDGEAWEVGRNRGSHLALWNRGQVVHIPTAQLDDGAIRLVWELVNVEIPKKLPDAPLAAVRQVWNDVATIQGN